MKLADVWGETVSVNPQHTQWFVEAWFDPEDWVTVGIIPQSEDQRPLWATMTAKCLASYDHEYLTDLQEGLGGLYGLYVVVNPVQQEAELHVNGDVITSSRGGIDAVREIYGFFLDLDVKDGSFSTQDEAIDFVKSLEIQPTMIVRNGEGGIHAWYRADGVTKDDMKAFHAYAEDKAGVQIDRLINIDRVLRLPGGIWYSKSSPRSGAVEIVGGTGQKVDLQKVRQVSAESFERHQKKWDYTKAKTSRMLNEVGRKSQAELTKNDSSVSWSFRLAMMKIENHVEAMDWSDILSPMGWTYLRTTSDGTRHWARPGQRGKSAHTDFEGSGVMSLHSCSSDTGLADLKAAEVNLSKMVVLLRLWYNDDASKMVTDFYKNNLGEKKND